MHNGAGAGAGERTVPGPPSPANDSLTTLYIAVLIAQVDTSVVNLAVRPIGRYFAADTPTLQWVVDSYNLVYAALLLTGACSPTSTAGGGRSSRALRCSC